MIPFFFVFPITLIAMFYFFYPYTIVNLSHMNSTLFQVSRRRIYLVSSFCFKPRYYFNMLYTFSIWVLMLKSTGGSFLGRSIWLSSGIFLFFSRSGSKIMLEKLEYNKTALLPQWGRAGHLMYFHISCLCAMKLYFVGFLTI